MKPSPSERENSRERKISQEKIAEINNALAIVLGNAQLLEREPGITPAHKEKLERIIKQVDRISDLLPG